MTVYEYRCRDCGRVEMSEHRADALHNGWHGEEGAPESTLCMGLLRRRWGFQAAPVMHAHFNRSVGRVVSSQRQFEQELRRASDERSAATGIEHRFVPVDPSDRAALGVTGEGLEATNRARRARGEREVSLDG